MNSLFRTLFLSAAVILAASNMATPQQMAVGSRIIRRNSEDAPTRWRYEFMRLRDPGTGKIPDNIGNLELQYAKTLPVAGKTPIRNGYEEVQSTSWTPLGPTNIGGRTRAIAVDVSHENVILAGCVSGGMWRSSDGGLTWQKTTGAGQLQSVSCVAQDVRPGHTSVFYYGTGEIWGNSAGISGNGIFKSTDDGQSWQPLPSTEANTPQIFSNAFQFVYDIAVDPSNSTEDVVYAAVYGGIMKSTDGGSTWNLVLGDTTAPNPLSFRDLASQIIWTDVEVTSKGVVYAVLSSNAAKDPGIWRSTNGDKGSFVNITPSGWPKVYHRIVLAAAPSDENEVYFLAETPGAGKVLPIPGAYLFQGLRTDGFSLWKYTYFSGDGAGSGGTWEDRSSNIPALGGQSGDYDAQQGYDMLIKVKPDDPNFVIIGGTNLYRSTDGFATPIGISDWIGGFSPTNSGHSFYPDQHPDQQTLVFLPSNSDDVIVGNDGGIYKTSDITSTPVTWTSLNNGYVTSQFYSVAMDQSANGDNVVIGGLQDWGDLFFNSSEAPTYWNILNEPSEDGGYAAIANGKKYYYVEYQNGVLWRFTLNNEGTNLAFTKITPAGGTDFLFLAPYVLDPNNNNIMYFAAGDSIWRDNALSSIPDWNDSSLSVTWTLMSNTAIANDAITALGISTAPANILYFGTESGKVYRVDSANTGDPMPVDIWSNKGLPDSASVSCIAVDPDNANNAMLVYSNYDVISLYYTTDGGNSWKDVAGNLEQYPDGTGDGPACLWASILNYGGTTFYYVATTTGLYSTTQLNGTSTVWAQEGAGTIGNVVCDMVISRQTDGKVIVATQGSGVFSSGKYLNSNGTLLSYDGGMYAGYLYLHAAGDVFANRLTAPTRSVKISSLLYYIMGDNVTREDTSHFYPVVYTSSPSAPGVPAASPIFTGPLLKSSFGWTTDDVSSQNISLSTTSSNDFFVGIKYDGKDEPRVGIDTVWNNRAWAYIAGDSTWYQLDSSDYPIPASLMIRAVVTEVTGIVDISSKVPKGFSLSQNYPNPFNPSTTIEYDLPRDEWVKVDIYDILGRKVATLVNALQAPGSYSVQWNGRNNEGAESASGVYLCLFQAGNYRAVKKMMLLR